MPKRKYTLRAKSEKKITLLTKTKKPAKRMKRESTDSESGGEEDFLSSANDTDESTSSRPQSALSDLHFSDVKEEEDNSNNSECYPMCSSPQRDESEEEATGGNYDGFASFLRSFNFMSDEEETPKKSERKSITTDEKEEESEDSSSDDSICFKRNDEPIVEEKEKSFRTFPLLLHNYELVFFEHPNIVPLLGYLKVTLLSGKASIYGYQLKQNQPVTVFSMPATGIMTIVSIPFKKDPLAFRCIRGGIQAQNIVKFKGCKKALFENCGPFTAVVSLQELELPPNLQFLKIYHPGAVSVNPTKSFSNAQEEERHLYASSENLSYTCSEDSSCLIFGTEHEEMYERIEKHLSKINKGNTSGWFEGSESSSESETEHKKKELINPDLIGSRIIVHGPKSSGKSTTIRYLINKFLNKYSEVYHLETDPGQTEFTPPGVLSLTRVTKPIFGPPFSHPLTPLKSIFIGSITPEISPPMHIRSVLKLIKYFNENFPRGILLVNTLGWIKGIGDMLLQVIKSNLNPVVEVQLLSELFPLITSTNRGLLKCKAGLGINSKKFEKRIDLKPQTIRESALLSYLGKCQPYFKQPTHLNAFRPVCVCWDEIAVYNFNKRLPYTRFYEALNCSIVALCSVDEGLMLMSTSPDYPNTLADEPTNNCLGFGFVRAVDEERHLLYIVTPVNLQTLKRVNAILSGNITVPHSVLLNQHIFDTGIYFNNKQEEVEVKSTKISQFKKLIKKSSR